MDNIREYLQYHQNIYNNTGEELIEDDDFDATQTYYNNNNQQNIYNPIGAKSNEDTVELPEKMPSLNKIKNNDKDPDGDLSKHYDKYGNENLYELKLDGVSILACYNNGNLNVYKRGDGDYGPMVNHILQYVNFPKININIHLRGEMMLLNSHFEMLKPYIKSKGKKGENSRSAINGAMTKVNIDPNILQYCHPVFYEIKYLEGRDGIKPQEQFEIMQSLGLTTVPYSIMNIRMNTQLFNEYIEQCRQQSQYRIDGIIVVPNIIVKDEKINKNPEHIFAYKKDSVAVTEVLTIEWNITSKDGYINPVVYYKPVILLGCEYEYFTGHNARFILEKQLGPGALIKLRINGDTIPGYDSTLIPAPVVYGPNCEYEWNENGVEIKLKYPDSYPQIKCMKIKYFLDRIGAKEWGLTTIMKLYNTLNITDLSKLLQVTKDQLMLVDRIESKSADNLLNELHNSIQKANMNQIMAGSGFFGEGLSENLMQKFLDEFPDWKFISPTFDQICNRRDFGPVRSKAIAENLDRFKEWISQFPELERKNTTCKIQQVSDKLLGHVINFSGFTDDVLVQKIQSMGGIFKENAVKTATIVVAQDLNIAPSKKVQHALSNPSTVRLYSRMDFYRIIQELSLCS